MQFFLYWNDCSHHFLHIVCQYLVSINFHAYILRFWSNHPETENLSGPWSWDILSLHGFCRSRQQDVEYLIPHCFNFSHHMLAIVNLSPSILAFMIRKPFLWLDIRNCVILNHAMSECSIIRIHKNPFFGDGCSRILKYI